jgi:hypothetical protein
VSPTLWGMLQLLAEWSPLLVDIPKMQWRR